MRRLLLSGLALAAVLSLSAQTRYLEEVFTGVIAQQDSTVYQQNYSFLPVLAGQSSEEVVLPSYFQSYMPADDDATDRPVMIINGTGSYLPQFVGGGVLGTIKDSVLVETARRFARMGYVAIVADYRQGWIPTAFGSPGADDQRIGSLLIAAYKGIQDFRALARYLRRTVAEEDNPLGIDPDRIALMGYGTGGYNAYNANFLDDPSEVLDTDVITKYYSPNTGEPYLDTARYGGPDGLQARPRNIVNHPGYDSRFQFVAGIGGATGDTTWVDGNEDEAPTVGLHNTGDRNAPYAVGDVFVPIGGGQSLFIINAHGARATIATANRLGVNDELEEVNATLRSIGDFTTLRSDALSDAAFTTNDGIETTFTVENMYSFQGMSGSRIANTYNYIDSATLALFVAGYNRATGATTTAAEYLALERASNPNITNPAAARRVLDTVMAFITPRAFVALELGTAEEVGQALDIVDISAEAVGFQVYPNPASGLATLEVSDGVELQLVALYDAQGRRISAATVSGTRFGMDVSALPVGLYRLYAQTSEGTLSHPIVVTR